MLALHFIYYGNVIVRTFLVAVQANGATDGKCTINTTWSELVYVFHFQLITATLLWEYNKAF